MTWQVAIEWLPWAAMIAAVAIIIGVSFFAKSPAKASGTNEVEALEEHLLLPSTEQAVVFTPAQQDRGCLVCGGEATAVVPKHGRSALRTWWLLQRGHIRERLCAVHAVEWAGILIVDRSKEAQVASEQLAQLLNHRAARENGGILAEMKERYRSQPRKRQNSSDLTDGIV